MTWAFENMPLRLFNVSAVIVAFFRVVFGGESSDVDHAVGNF
jgi:hypothetical protein